jgi:hypothetical protein
VKSKSSHFTRAELKDLTLDDPFAEAKKKKKDNVVRHLTTSETVLWCAQTRVKGEYMPTFWANIKTFIRKAAAARIPPSFCLATAYSQHGKHYNWEPRSTREDFPPIAVLPSKPATRPSSPLSDLSLSGMDGMAGAAPVQLVQVENTSGKKRK